MLDTLIHEGNNNSQLYYKNKSECFIFIKNLHKNTISIFKMACSYLSELQEALLGKAFSVKSGYLNYKSSNLFKRNRFRVIATW